ncbi:MAG TPA: adenylate/guanylate cyclase domain-containing protein [Gaiellaceae bacterium]|nr:adenylate/guanylate cyclase domain-containing protein [Gaiellaceae bacterium]
MASRKERKVVTVVFADLVGFTSRAESLDPEDVHAILTPYHERLRRELERHGGTVEKFIGDAVMAVFGAPVVHEDDAERAVRAALAIRDWALEEDGIEVRIAVNTGEALVSVDARPERGEAMVAGDVVNTAARLQSAAPVNGVLVGETTRRATDRAIEYAGHAPIDAKGKAEPVPVWEALHARSALGVDVDLAPATELVGRQHELGQLTYALERARRERRAQLVTIVGVPGMGKSRLIMELSRIVQDDPDLIRWRQGRSLPYGEGISFWALGEMVKAEAGILESDDPRVAREKLVRAVGESCGGDAPWIAEALGALVGLGDESGERPGDAFAAWRRFLETLAEQRPTVLVFEDLHWADDGLLDFVDDLVDWAGDVPLLVVASARPELLARRPEWGGGKPNALTLSLAPLSEQETAQLVHTLLERSVLPADVQAAVLARAGGNPLYAEEFARLVAERGTAAGDLPVPDTVQALIAARLDALDPAAKRVLQDAAVVGKVFWPGALADADEDTLRGLERRELIRRERRSSVEDEAQYAFRHVLVRDVAYNAIPRAERAVRHAAVADWIEGLGRGDEAAELLAHHYARALEYARAAGGDTTALAARARTAFASAGRRGRGLGALLAAGRYYEAALDLTEEHDLTWADLVLQRALALQYAAVEDIGPVEEAVEVFRAAGALTEAAQAELVLGDRDWLSAQRESADRHFSAAEALIAGMPPSEAKAAVLSELARMAWRGDDPRHGVELASQVLEMTDRVEARASAFNSRGISRLMEGDRGGIGDLEASVELARGRHAPELVRALGNLASMLGDLGELERSGAMFSEALALGEELGFGQPITWLRGEVAHFRFYTGDWKQAKVTFDDLLGIWARNPFWMEPIVRANRARLLAAVDLAGIGDELDVVVEGARRARDAQMVCPSLGMAARVYEDLGDARSLPLALEVLTTAAVAPGGSMSMHWLSDVWSVLHRHGREEELTPILDRLNTAWADAVRALLGRRFDDAAAIYAGMGNLVDEAETWTRAAESLAAEGRAAEADAAAQRALAFWHTVGATARIRATEQWLAASA